MDLWLEPAFQAIISVLHHCVLGLDEERRVRAAGAAERVGFLPREVIGKPLSELLPGAAAAEVERAMGRLAGGQAVEPLSFTTEDGKSFGGNLVAVRVAERWSGTLLVLWDATAHVGAEKARRDSEAFFRLLAENSSDIISVKSPEGRFLYVSPSVERLIGFTAAEMVGKSVDEVWHPDDLARARARSPDGLLRPDPGGTRIHHRLRRRDGEWIWAESDTRPIEWHGEPAVICDTRDVTQRKLAEDKARAAMAELEEARRRAEAANRAKSEFLAAMSHALRTPLHGILGMAELLQQTHLRDNQREYLDAIRESGKLLHSLLNDLQDLNKIESGQLDLRSVPFDLVETVEGLSDMLGPEATSHGLELACEVAPELPTVVVGDPDRLRQVLVNVLGVGIRSGARSLSLCARRGQPGRVLFELALAGRASGTERAARRGDHGSALSLSIARGLVSLLGGELAGDLKPGEVVRFELPLTAAPQATAGSSAPLQGVRLLLAVANSDERPPLRDALEQAGAEVELASGGVEVIRSLRDDPRFGGAILDAALPDIDGASLAALIRARPELQSIRILLITGADDPPVLPGLSLNARLRRPVRPELLVRAVSAVVADGRFDESNIGDGHDRTVLLVEDNELNLRLARDMLRRAGYRVIGARSGSEALDYLGRYAIDAVLMDIQLPDMDGLEATAQIRRLPVGARIPVIAMTAHAMKGDAERFIEAGLDEYLSKPVNQEELLRALSRGIQRRTGT